MKYRNKNLNRNAKNPFEELDKVNKLKNQILNDIKNGRLTKAEQKLEYLRKNQRNHPKLLAKNLFDLAKSIFDLSFKIKLYQYAVECNPIDTVTLTSYATALAQIGESKRAFELFEKSLSIDNQDAVTLSSYASALAEIGDSKRAFELFEKSLIIDNQETVTLNSYATALAGAGETKRAIELFENSLAIDDKNTNTLNYYAAALAITGQQQQTKLRIEKHLQTLTASISDLKRYQNDFDSSEQQTIQTLYNDFKTLLASESDLNINTNKNTVRFKSAVNKHFTEINFETYKVFNNFKLEGLNRINLFVGKNNTGKTTLLEAVYCLIMQNDLAEIFKIIRQRHKLNALNARWLDEHFSDINLTAQFNGINISQVINKYIETDIEQGNDYLTSYQQQSTIEQDTLFCKIHTFSQSDLKRQSSPIEQICHAAFKSPYFKDQEAILRNHAANLEQKTEEGALAIKSVIEFIKQVDDSIDDIQLSEDYSIQRFLVNSSKFPEHSVDITQYGEGLQRIFEIALTFAAAKNGVVCIDEFETAIHYSLLIDFTRFIQQLAEKFNVQVFLSTHSKECVDAFVKNDYQNELITAFFLKLDGSQVIAKRIEGERLADLVEQINLDIRGKA